MADFEGEVSNLVAATPVDTEGRWVRGARTGSITLGPDNSSTKEPIRDYPDISRVVEGASS